MKVDRNTVVFVLDVIAGIANALIESIKKHFPDQEEKDD